MGIFDFKITTTRKNNDNEYDSFGYNGGYDGFDESSDLDNTSAFGMEADSSADFAPAPATVALKIVNPKSYEEAATIADFLLNGNTVLLNVESIERAQAIRLLDYLSGAVRMVGGVMTKVGKTTIVVAPKNVDVSSIEAMVGSAE